MEYSNVDDAAKAIRALHGRKLYGRPLRVRFMTVEGKGRMDYSTADNKGSTATSGSFGTYGYKGEEGKRFEHEISLNTLYVLNHDNRFCLRPFGALE